MANDTFFNEDWLALQRSYWDNWTAMSRKAMGLGGTAPLTAPWENALEQWWKALAPAAPEASKMFMERMLDQGKHLFRLAETAATPGSDAGANPLTLWLKGLEELQTRFSGAATDQDSSTQRLLSFWEMPLDNWQRMMSSMSPLPGDALRNMPHDQLKDHLNRALSAPGLGYTREEQGQYQELTRCAMQYQTALQEYSGFYNQLGMKSLQHIGSHFQNLSDEKPIESARELYDHWVNCCEEVYAAEVATPEYAKIHGHLINAQMALKKRMALIVDENLGTLNMPTRSELRTVQDRLQDTRRDNKQLRQRLHALEKQVAALIGDTATNPTLGLTTAASATAKTPLRRKSVQPD
jgi:polyhydroxyalkanoate synthase subunit PhaE